MFFTIHSRQEVFIKKYIKQNRINTHTFLPENLNSSNVTFPITNHNLRSHKPIVKALLVSPDPRADALRAESLQKRRYKI